MKIKHILISCMLSVTFVSCNSWLDVKPKQELDTEQVYESERGFEKALMGCYVKLKNAYANKLLTETTEYLAQHWVVGETSDLAKFTNFEYDNDFAEDTFKPIFNNIYNVIVQLNDLLYHMEENGENVFFDDKKRDMIKAEALAMRAFCHFDIMRLFGQLPNNQGEIKVALPYAELVSHSNPPYYGYEDFVEKILKDYTEAEELLLNCDPIIYYSFDELGENSNITNYDYMTSLDEGKITDEFFAYRKIRFNYYAVKALMARTYLYLGQTDKAYTYAKSVIDAEVKGVDSYSYGDKVISFNSASDFANDFNTLPSETLLAMDVYDIETKLTNLSENSTITFSSMSASNDRSVVLDDLFEGKSLNNRFINLWVTTVKPDTDGKVFINYTKKYWVGDNTYETQSHIMPLIRLSELYLIAIETSESLDEANELLYTYYADRGYVQAPLQTPEEVKDMVIKEYNREFYAEGQMFFTYKRLNMKNMMWREAEVIEENYIAPLPSTEGADLI